MTELERRLRRRRAQALKEANQKLEQEDLAKSAFRVLIDVIFICIGLLIGFNVGIRRTHAAVLQKNHLSATWSQGATVVGPIPEEFPEEVPPDAIDPADVPIGTLSDAVMVERVGEPHERWESLGVYKITFYCACRQCSGKWGHRTSSGATCQEGVTAACAILPEWAHVKIDGFGERIIQDIGAGVNGRHIDIFYEDHDLCNDLGKQFREVWIRRE